MREPIHPWRWRFLAVWILVFTVLVFWVVRQNRGAIHDLQITKANLHQLEDTNCALSSFLNAAATTRLRAAQNDVDPRQEATDRRAANAYRSLAKSFDGHNCVGGKEINGSRH